jgi:AraC family transcriptional regulator
MGYEDTVDRAAEGPRYNVGVAILERNVDAPRIWSVNALLNGASRHTFAQIPAGTLSIKSVLKGSAAWRTPSGRYTVDPDSYLILNHGQAYDLEIEACTETETLCVFFEPETAAAVMGREVGFFECLRLQGDDVRESLARLNSLSKRPHENADDAIYSLLERIMHHENLRPSSHELIVAARESTRTEALRVLARAQDRMLSSLDRTINLKDLSRDVGLSPYHLHRLHRTAFGLTPHEFHIRARLQKARRLLREGLGVAQVTIELGFESVPTFTRLFRRHFAMTPGQFRNIG